ncbi:hypothetical protein D918_09078 [Trichuris suis]|uniref:Uncharacterized protein n=1 Tax=Trichuris suis TaxID=68888 RepID=A0A085LWN4_9BILA|nr:hypothetical protein M513_09743 [Trichuris suis]KHJ40869.1 hypothetical protein D918_09078 [Trichuris suis]
MGEPVASDEPPFPKKPKKEEDKEDDTAVRSRRSKRATVRPDYKALEAFTTSEESEDGNYEPDTDACSDTSSNDESVSGDRDSQKDSAKLVDEFKSFAFGLIYPPCCSSRSDGLGDLLAKYQEAYKVAIFGVPSSSADQLSKRPKAVPKVLPALSPDYCQHFTNKLQCISELNQSIATTEKLREERRLAIEFLKHRANSSHVGRALKELHEIGSLLKSFGVTNVHTSHDYLKDMQDRVNKMRNAAGLNNSVQLDKLDDKDSEEADFTEQSD